MNTARNENGKYTDLMLVQALFRTFSLQWMVVIQILTDFEKTRGVVTEGNDPAYSYLSEVTAKDLGVSTGVANLTLDHLVPPVTISLEFKPGKPWPPPIKTALTLNEVTEVSTGNGETAQIIPDDPSDPSLEVLVTFKGYSTKMHASEEARLKWWDETLRILSQPEYTGWQILWGPTAKREAIIEEAEAADLLPENKNKTPRSRVFIPLDKAEALTPENIAIKEDFSNYVKIPTNEPSRHLFNLWNKPILSSDWQTKEISTGNVDSKLLPIVEQNLWRPILKEPAYMQYLELRGSLFRDSPQFNHAELEHYVDKFFGVPGLKMLGIMLILIGEKFALDNDGIMVFDLPEVMELAGYKKGPNRAYKTEKCLEVIKIQDLLFSLHYRAIKTNGSHFEAEEFPYFHILNTKISGNKRTARAKLKGSPKDEVGNYLLQDVYQYDRYTRTVKVNQWYTDAFTKTTGRSLQYTYTEKKLFRLDENKRKIALRIGINLALEWRHNPEDTYLKRSVKSLLLRAKLPLKGVNAARDRKRLFRELDFMKDHGLIGGYEIEPTENGKSLEDMVLLYPPGKLKELNQKIAAGKLVHLDNKRRKIGEKLVPPQELSSIIEKSGLSANKFAETLGVSRGLISEIRSGKKKISSKLSQKIRAAFPLG
jgi:DNA-binding transcriptional regulator YiaG